MLIYNNVLQRLISDEKSIIKADSLDDLMKVVRVKQRAKRPISRTTLDLGEGIKMGIGFYSFVRWEYILKIFEKLKATIIIYCW